MPKQAIITWKQKVSLRYASSEGQVTAKSVVTLWKWEGLYYIRAMMGVTKVSLDDCHGSSF